MLRVLLEQSTRRREPDAWHKVTRLTLPYSIVLDTAYLHVSYANKANGRWPTLPRSVPKVGGRR